MVKDLRTQKRIIEIELETIGFKYPLDEIVNIILSELKTILERHVPEKTAVTITLK